jgi:hypothetical protein
MTRVTSPISALHRLSVLPRGGDTGIVVGPRFRCKLGRVDDAAILSI